MPPEKRRWDICLLRPTSLREGLQNNLQRACNICVCNGVYYHIDYDIRSINNTDDLPLTVGSGGKGETGPILQLASRGMTGTHV